MSVRALVFALLAALPVALVGWVAWRGAHPEPPKARLVATAPRTALPSDPDLALAALVQGPLAGAQLKGKPALYDAETLFDYIDGAAPTYIQRQFRKLAAAELVAAGGGELTCDVYDMTAPENATSIFEAERSAAARPVAGWPEAITGPMSFVFRQGRYYVKLTAFDAAGEAALPAIARAVRERMT